MAIVDAEFRRMKETLEVLAGQRGNSLQAAVRQQDLGRIRELLADFETNAQALAKAIAAELSASIVALQAATGQNTQAITGIRARTGNVTVPAMTAPVATAAPTMAQYNALRADVLALRQAIGEIHSAIIS
ncbi:hypothetical protein [Agrobacterium tumefaciens]|uniref:hypothetical protein n=1 Tax=Agrobacterium tumefaciens TaxID=358 RepID=UPI00157234BD|nr:hypothetical protein [Agrobacterium tumefaciens]